MVDGDLGLVRHRQFGGQQLAARADGSDGQDLRERFIEADAAEVDGEVVFQPADHHLVNAGQILPLANGARDLIEQIQATQNIQVEYLMRVLEVHGTDHLESISIICDRSGTVNRVPANSLFVFIGAEPCTSWLAGVVERNERGFVLTGPDLLKNGKRPKGWTLERDPGLLETSIPGVFAVGDVRYGSVKRVASGVGEGSIAIQFVHQYLSNVS